MDRHKRRRIEEVREAALEVMLNNAHGPCHGLPRTAGWGYPEPYTRDAMIVGLAILASGEPKLMASLRRVLESCAATQTARGHIASLAHDPEDLGASDTTPLFLLTVGLYRQVTGETDFLHHAVERALTWMDYQSPEDRVIVSQLPTSDWRDEQWVPGFGLFVNTVVYAYLRVHGQHEKARLLRSLMHRFTVTAAAQHRHVHEGLVVRGKPYYALWSYKVYSSERFDLLGNSLAMLTGLASPSRTEQMISWIERECRALRRRGDLVVDLPPNLFPYIQRDDPDWRPRYETHGKPGDYHNGGIWPFICGFYIAALVGAGRLRLARRRMLALAEAVRPARVHTEKAWGFNEWIKAQDGTPRGQDWQSWSAAMTHYAATCVLEGRTPLFDRVREASSADWR